MTEKIRCPKCGRVEVENIRDGKLSVSNSFSSGSDGSQVTETDILQVTDTDIFLREFWLFWGWKQGILDERGLIWA